MAMMNIDGVEVRVYELAPEGEVKGKKVVRIRRPTEYEILHHSLPRFGPIYGADQLPMEEAKQRAWQMVFFPRSESQVVNETLPLYLDAIKRVETEARATYATVNITSKSSEFCKMMIRDGIFFLQLAFLILGKYIKYGEDDPIFGRKQSRRKIHKWVYSVFFVGNQIPLVVLKELIKQQFFQDVIAHENWSNMPPFGLCKRILYELLIQPELEKMHLAKRAKNRRADKQQQQPCDVLHALQVLMLGPVQSVHYASVFEEDEEEEDNDFDLEATRYSHDNISNQETTDPNSTFTIDGIRNLLNQIVSQNANDNQSKRIFSSASDLKRSGIRIRKLQNRGIRSVHFKNYYISAFLYLPALQVDDTTEMILRHLKTYEICQPLWKHKHESSSYLRLMSDLVQTPEDVRLLKEKGVIEGRFEYAEPEIFNRLSSSDNTTLTQELRDLRSMIADYSSPLIHYQRLLDVVVFLTLLQTLFTVLAYFRPPT